MLIEAFEKRTHPKDADRDPELMRLFGLGSRAASGVEITDNTALSCTAILCGVRLLSEIVAALPKHTFRRLGKPNEKERAYDHPAYRILHDQFNPYMSAYDGWRWLQANAIVRGMGVAQIQYKKNGQLEALWPLPSSRVRMIKARDGLAYEYSDPDKGVKNIIPYDEMFRYSGFSLNGLVGMVMAENSKETIGNALAMEEYTGRFFGNNATPPSVIEYPGTLEAEDIVKIKESVETMYGGLSNAHRVAVLEEGAKWTTLGVSPKDSLLLEGKTFQIQEAARILNIPPFLLHDHSRSTFNNIEHLAIAFRTYSVWLWVANIENAINTSLFTPVEQKTYFAEFLLDGLERADAQSQAQAIQTEIYSGTITRNEARAIKNRAPLEWLDDPLVPANMTTAERVSNPPAPIQISAPEPTEDEDADQNTPRKAASNPEKRNDFGTAGLRLQLRRAFWPMIQEAGQRLAKAEARRLRDIIKKTMRSRGEAELLEALEKFYQDPGQMPEVVARILGPVFRAYGEAQANAAAQQVGGDTPNLAEWINGYIEIAARDYDTSHLFQLRAILRDEGGDVDAVEERIGEWEENTGEKLANSESVNLGEAIAKAVFVAFGVTKWRWQGSGTSCPICQELEGKIVCIEGEPFFTPEDSIDAGGKNPFRTSTNIMHPPLHNGCDCVVMPE